MPKLQMIKRANGSLIYSLNMPLSMIEDFGWKKGEDLILEDKEVNGKKFIIISRDKLNEMEVQNDTKI